MTRSPRQHPLGGPESARLAVAPILLGAGERLFGDGLAVPGYSVSGLTCAAGVAHANLTRRPS